MIWLTPSGGGRGAEHAAVQFLHRGCDQEVWTRHEQAGYTGNA